MPDGEGGVVVRALGMLGSVFILAAYAEAVPITFDFTGTVAARSTTPSGIFKNQGTAVIGTFTYDTELVDALQGNDQWDRFLSRSPENQTFVFNITVTVGNVTLTSADNVKPVGSDHHFFDIVDSASLDRYFFYATRQVESDDAIAIRLRDVNPTPPDGISAGTGSLADVPWTVAPDVARFDRCADSPCSFIHASDKEGRGGGSLQFDVDTISIAAVPEPSTLLLLGAGLVGYARRRR